jgi:hypothetical protein
MSTQKNLEKCARTLLGTRVRRGNLPIFFTKLINNLYLLGLAYFGAIEAFGVEKAAGLCFDRDENFKFIQTHLIGCTKEKNSKMFGELTKIISSKIYSLDKIIHFKPNVDQNSIFSKTALTWAIENSDQYMVMGLLKLEHEFHDNENEGLECLQDNLRNHSLLPWIFETYRNFYPKTHCWSSVMTVFVKLFLLTHLPFFVDIYSDITLAISYGKYSRENFSITQLWSCDNIYINSSCYEKIALDHPDSYHTDDDNLMSHGSAFLQDIQDNFNIAFWLTIILLAFTFVFYIFYTVFVPSSALLTSLIDTKDEFSKTFCCRCPLKIKLPVRHQKTFLIIIGKLLLPFVHSGWYLVYLSSPKSSQHQPSLDKITTIWNNIKVVENGVESSIQLLLQLWLLRPFLPIILSWDFTELVSRSATGLINFVTFEKYPACYIEKALFKILLTIILRSLGISLMKKKPGQTIAKTLPMFISIFAQTVGRIVGLASLVLMTTSLGYYKYAIFFVPHVMLVFLINILFEAKTEGKIEHILQVMRCLFNGISSIIVMIQLIKEDEVEHKRHPSFLSHFCFQVLILLENLLLVCFPFIANGRYYPTEDCFPTHSQIIAIYIVACSWLVGVMFQVIHYKFCSPLSKKNGPQASPSWCCPNKISCLATLCWKKEIQRIELNCQLHCKDYR